MAASDRHAQHLLGARSRQALIVPWEGNRWDDKTGDEEADFPKTIVLKGFPLCCVNAITRAAVMQ